MTQQVINIGAGANDSTGDPIRTAFAKVNANFTELYSSRHTTQLVTASSYTATSSDYYIGVNYAGPVSIILPSVSDGNQLVIKDESGRCASYPITIVGTIDNSTGGAILTVNNGALTLIYRSGWRLI